MAELWLGCLNITIHTEGAMHSMKAYVWCWSKVCGSLDEIPSVTIGSCKSKNDFNSAQSVSKDRPEGATRFQRSRSLQQGQR